MSNKVFAEDLKVRDFKRLMEKFRAGGKPPGAPNRSEENLRAAVVVRCFVVTRLLASLAANILCTFGHEMPRGMKLVSTDRC